MANLTESGTWSDDLYKIETIDLVLGGDGAGDIANKQAHTLGDRTKYLKNQVEISPKYMIHAALGGYTDNDLIILEGCEITPNLPGDSEVSAGAIFYNDKIYRVAGDSFVTTTGGQTLVWKIRTDVSPSMIYLDGGNSGEGIADYDDSSVKLYSDIIQGEWISLEDSDLENSWELGASVGYLKYKKDILGVVTIKGYINSPGSLTGSTIYTMPLGYRPFPANAVGQVIAVAQRLDNSALEIIKVDGQHGYITMLDTDGTDVGANKNFYFHFSYSTKP